MQFVDQYALGPFYEFKARHIITSDSGKTTGYRHLDEIGRRLASRMLRRRKADVAIQLPERSDKVLYVPMTREQSEIHDECRTAVAQLASKWQRHRFLSEKDRKRLLLLLSRMRMACDSTFVIDQKTRFDTKIAEALQLVAALIESGDEKAVIFSQWERMTRIMAEELDRAGIAYQYLHGGIGASRRRNLVETFNSDTATRVFLSTDAGSTGLNLQAASLVINLDRPWNPAVLEQRIARVYRIGQRRNIQVVNMVAAGTIEERMTATLNFKGELFDGIFDGGDDQITLDDNRLTRIIEAVAEVVPGQSTVQGTLIAESEEDDSPSASAETIAPEALLEKGMSFLGSLARTLRSPEATERLLDTIVHTDADGHTELRIPVESRKAVADILSLFSQ